VIVIEVDIVGMPVPLTQKCRFRALPRPVARQKIPLNLTEIKELSNDEKLDLFDKNVQTLEVPGRRETAGIQAFLEDSSQGMETIRISAWARFYQKRT
jgi:hypothetical protein